MPTSYPGATDSFTHPNAGDPSTNPSQAGAVTDLQDAVEALEINAGRGVLGYAQVTASQGTFTSLTDLTGLSVTVTVAANRRIRVTGVTAISSSVANDICRTYIREGSTNLQNSQNSSPVTGQAMPVMPVVVLTPTAAAHTYKLSGFRASGTGNLTSFADSEKPASILVEDIGAA